MDWKLISRIGAATYVLTVLVTAMRAFLPEDPDGTAWYVLQILTLPVSVVVGPPVYAVNMWFFDSTSVWLGVFNMAAYVAAVIAELLLGRILWKSLREA